MRTTSSSEFQITSFAYSIFISDISSNTYYLYQYSFHTNHPA